MIVHYLREFAKDQYDRAEWRKDMFRAAAARLELLDAKSSASPRSDVSEGGSEKAGWKCEACQNCGTIRFDRASSIYDKINLVAFAHTDASEGRCEGGISRLKLWPIPADAAAAVARGDR